MRTINDSQIKKIFSNAKSQYFYSDLSYRFSSFASTRCKAFSLLWFVCNLNYNFLLKPSKRNIINFVISFGKLLSML